MKLGSWAGAAVVAAIWGLSATMAPAETTTEYAWTTFVIHGVTPPQGEQVAMPGQPLLRQPVTSTRAARLEAESPSLAGMGSAKTFPAGTKMFGVKVPDGWIYCAVSESTVKWLFLDLFACYQDTDGDGWFDHARSSGAPFNGIPLFVFQPGPPKALPTPVPYSFIPYREGPKVELAFVWRPIMVKVKKGEVPPPPSRLTVATSILTGDMDHAISTPQTFDVWRGWPQVFSDDGGRVTLLGLTPEGGLRYRVDSSIPAQIEPLKMTLTTTTTTYWYVMSY